MQNPGKHGGGIRDRSFYLEKHAAQCLVVIALLMRLFVYIWLEIKKVEFVLLHYWKNKLRVWCGSMRAQPYDGA